MLSLVYGSSANRAFSEYDLIYLLAHCRQKNAQRDITGMLLYQDGNFIQALEGPDDAVKNLFEIIRMDTRHRGVIRLLERPIEQRQFPDWSMGFRHLNDDTLRELPGYNDFMNLRLDSEVFQPNQDLARYLLDVFRRNLIR